MKVAQQQKQQQQISRDWTRVKNDMCPGVQTQLKSYNGTKSVWDNKWAKDNRWNLKIFILWNPKKIHQFD